MYIFYILNVILSPLVHTCFSVGGLLVIDLTSLKQNTVWCVCFSSERTASAVSQSVPWEQPCLSATYRSLVKKGKNPQCDASGSMTPTRNQAGPSGPRRRLLSPVYLLVSKVPTCSW